MSFEIELKARVDDPVSLKNRLSVLGNYCYDYEKDDSYWTFPENNAARLRLRRESKTDSEGRTSGVNLVTCKTREMRGGIEINDEQELAVSSADVFEKILVRLGLQPLVKKEKRGSAWEFYTENAPAVLAELSCVKNLGWFVELEILCPVRDERAFSEYQARLLALLDTFAIPRDKIEPRPYTELLKNSE